MTETSPAPQESIAEALHDLSGHTAALAQREVNSALQEMGRKVRRESPAAALLAASGVLALFATVSVYWLSLRLLEKRLSPPAAAFAATCGYGAATAGAGVLGYLRLRKAPLPLPTETARAAARAAAEADVESRQEEVEP